MRAYSYIGMYVTGFYRKKNRKKNNRARYLHTLITRLQCTLKRVSQIRDSCESQSHWQVHVCCFGGRLLGSPDARPPLAPCLIWSGLYGILKDVKLLLLVWDSSNRCLFLKYFLMWCCVVPCSMFFLNFDYVLCRFVTNKISDMCRKTQYSLPVFPHKALDFIWCACVFVAFVLIVLTEFCFYNWQLLFESTC